MTMDKNQFLPIERLIRTAELAKVDDNPAVQKAVMAVLASGDRGLAENLEWGLSLKAVHERMVGIPFKPPARPRLSNEHLKGRHLWLGKVKGENYPYIQPMDDLTKHMAVFGASGCGKTNLLYGTGLQCMKKGIPVWFFDKDKQDYRHLKRFEPDLLILDAVENLPQNFLMPPTGVSPKHWLAAFVQTFCKVNSLLDGSESLLLKVLKELYQEHGVFSGKAASYPTILDLYYKVRGLRFKRTEYRFASFQSSIMNRLEALIALHGEMFQYSRGLPVEELARRSVVFEVKGLTERMGRFVLNMILQSLFLHKIAVGERSNTIQLLVIIDEAKWLAPPVYNDLTSFSPLSYVLAQVREVGLGLILADQSAELDKAVFVNTLAKICFRLGSGEDMEKIRKNFSLTNEQADFINKLKTGECIVRVPSEEPFLIKTLRVNFE